VCTTLMMFSRLFLAELTSLTFFVSCTRVRESICPRASGRALCPTVTAMVGLAMIVGMLLRGPDCGSYDLTGDP